MGNWRTVHVTGQCATAHVPALRRFLGADYADDNWGCLHNGGICGLQNWADESIDAVGNLAERDFTVEDVAEEVRKIIRDVAPSLRVRIDCGGDWETLSCVATVLTDEDGTVRVSDPMVAAIPEISKTQIQRGLLDALRR